MKKQQLLVVGLGFVVLIGFFFFGRTVPTQGDKPAASATGDSTKLDFPAMLAIAKQKITPTQLAYVTQLEHAVVRGDVLTQQIQAYRQLAAFWGDTAKIFVPYAEYTALAAKLENSKKSLTFAANLFFEDLQTVQEAPLRSWEADQAKDLYNKVLTLDPADDSAKVSLGSCYIFGGSGSPQETMQGILKIREVAQRDTANTYAQYMLGLAGIVSGQTDKAIDRFQAVLRHDPDNLDVQMRLADLYEEKGDRESSRKAYLNLRSTYTRLVSSGKLKSDTSFLKEINKRIRTSPGIQ
ncbi:tetratricopeptide repeat protein [Dinghuibacter silviterrae]|uniref:Tetratricopeptide repeat protein n=1 Tax=Dinghuibacter silviterrae TaxID=1539049 RepID=A0A4R8DNW5_9BACT|nr:tetratricopeptide repeat protein [Dinghuibacter silviterrae]TDW99508.1 tetratricopeptide repeat protein [Dinghuibacter silviterrae]